jgi:hypothetical protein
LQTIIVIGQGQATMELGERVSGCGALRPGQDGIERRSLESHALLP